MNKEEEDITTANHTKPEIVFRVSFGVTDDSDEFIVTKNGKYNFVGSEQLKNDKTNYEVAYPDYRYHLVKINQKYLEQALKAKESMLEKGEKDWPMYDFGRISGQQPEFYRKTLWLLSHDNLDGWKESFTPLDAILTVNFTQYRRYCDLMYGDDSVSEYREDASEAKKILQDIKILMGDNRSDEASTEDT